MAEEWTSWEGHFVNGVFPLRRFLGASDHSAVFLTEHAARNLPDAAIKLVPAPPDPALADAQLARWRRAAGLSHPHLIRLFESGRCELGGQAFLFVVMEYAAETLAQILPIRALTAQEALELLPPCLEALAFLHGRNLVQGQLQPPNILVVADRVKLASDTVRSAGESAAAVARFTPYDAPETRGGHYSPAGDVWGLGMTLVEALTQRVPESPDERSAASSIPSALSPAFLSNVRRCLSRNAAERPTIDELRMQMSPTGAPQAIGTPPRAPEAATPARPPAVATTPRAAAVATTPRAPEAATTPQKETRAPVSARRDAPSPSATMSRNAPSASARKPEPERRSLLPAAAVVFAIVVGVWVGLHLLRTPSAVRRPVPTASSAPPATSPGAADAAAPEGAPGPRAAERPAAAPASAEASGPRSTPSTKAPSSQPRAEGSVTVLHEEIPQVPRSARETIHGHIKIAVRVTVDRGGNVIDESLEIAGPSRYFARLASAAARKWKFAPDESQATREWLVRFDFARDGTTGEAAVPRS